MYAMYSHLCVHIYPSIHGYVFTSMYLCSHLHLCIHIYVFTSIHLFIYIHIYVSVFTSTYMYSHLCVHIYSSICMYYSHLCIYVHTDLVYSHLCNRYVYSHLCIYVHIYVYGYMCMGRCLLAMTDVAGDVLARGRHESAVLPNWQTAAAALGAPSGGVGLQGEGFSRTAGWRGLMIDGLTHGLTDSWTHWLTD